MIINQTVASYLQRFIVSLSSVKQSLLSLLLFGVSAPGMVKKDESGSSTRR